MALTKEQRDQLPASSFAVPGRRALPIHDARHVRMAWSQLSRVQGLTSAERQAARQHILRRAHELGIDTGDWEIHAVSYRLDAMSLAVPDVADHPNRMPFSGILTRVDEPSDNPPNGSNGKRTYIPKSVAEAALPSLLGMAIDYTEDLDGHDKRSKIGVITEANVIGNAIQIAGFFYASDFPEECARIKSEKDALGFSYECQAAIADPDADPWVVTRCAFTGAAVLYKHLAAYTTTSLAAKADKDFDMSPEELTAALAAAMRPLAEQVGALSKKVEAVEAKTLEASAVRDKVRTHADAIRACAANMEAAGIGTHATQGHVNVLRHMAASMEAEATMGNVPHIYRDHDYLSRSMEAGKEAGKGGEKLEAAVKDLTDKIAAAQTQLKDIEAKAAKAGEQPQRKTFDASTMALLNKYDLAAAANEGKLTVAQVDKALANLPTAQRIEQKLKLQAAGILAA